VEFGDRPRKQPMRSSPAAKYSGNPAVGKERSKGQLDGGRTPEGFGSHATRPAYHARGVKEEEEGENTKKQKKRAPF